MSALFEKHITFLFFGDSITDANRDRDDGNHLGTGYVFFLAAELQRRRPDLYVKIFNRGIGGHALHNLLGRVDEDCINLHPDIVTVQCGVNDATYRSWPSEKGIPFTPEVFEARYRELLDRIRAGLPDAKIILMTPFLRKVISEHYLNLSFIEKYGDIVTRLAAEYNCTLVPLGRIFAPLFDEGRGALYTVDGAHPTPLGAQRIAESWMEYAERVGGPYWDLGTPL